MEKIECKSKLEMLDIYFSKFSFEQNKKKGQIKLNTDFNISYAQKNEDTSQIKVQIDTIINDDSGCFLLSLQTIGLFKIDKTGIEEELANTILKKNTVSIMFPFIRSQVALLTAQPGLTSVLLQPIDVNLLVDKVKD